MGRRFSLKRDMNLDCFHHAAGHAFWGNLHGPCARTSGSPATDNAGATWERLKPIGSGRAARSDRERQEDTRKTGQFTGSFAINRSTGRNSDLDFAIMS